MKFPSDGILTPAIFLKYAGETLYEVVGMDVFATEARIGNIASEVVMDSLTKDLPQIPVPGVPPMLVLNVQLPSASPALMSAAEDGPGYQVHLHASTLPAFICASIEQLVVIAAHDCITMRSRPGH